MGCFLLFEDPAKQTFLEAEFEFYGVLRAHCRTSVKSALIADPAAGVCRILG
jgi:hypothetical protein